jgi:hypothetical protein
MHVRSQRSFCLSGRLILLLAAAFLPVLAHAQGKKANPTSKFYVADVDGDAEIDTGSKVDELNKQSVYNAQGTVIETKANSANAMVFSNGTGAFFDSDTRLEVKQFEQEPFVPNRIDMDVEPSVSQTQAYLPRGTVGLCTSKLVAGSSMSYSTTNASINIRGGKVVIQNDGGTTTVSMIEGDGSVRAGNVDMGGQTLHDGQQAVIKTGPPGTPPQIKIQNIPSNQKDQLSAKVTMACNAKKTVYFQVKTVANRTEQSLALQVSALAASGSASSNPDSSSSSSTSSTSSISSGSSSPITAFDGDSANSTAVPTQTTTTTQQIVAVPVTPANLPVQFDSSPSTSSSPSGSP